MGLNNNRIVYLCYRRFPDTNFENYSKFTADSGFDVSIISYLSPGQRIFERNGNRKIFRIALQNCKSKRKKYIKFLLDAIHILKIYEFDIIHIHHSCSYFLLYKLLLRKKCKFIFHITSYPISKNSIEKYKKMILIYFQSLFMDRIIIQSIELKERLIGIRNICKSKIVPVGFNSKLFIENSIEFKKKIRETLNFKNDSEILVYCGAISKFRKLHILIKAFAKVIDICPNVKLLMIGFGDYYESLKKFAKKNLVAKNIIFTGKIEQKKVAQYLCAADIGLSFVPINENYNYNPPLKTFEYLACGLPTIATKTVSNSKIIENHYNGILVKDNADEIAINILKLLRDQNKLSRLRDNSRASILKYDYEIITKSDLIPIYEELLLTK